ncbi:Utp14 domain containing protein [Amanita muscaria]
MSGRRHTTGRAQAKTSFNKGKPTLKQSNVIGYAKRQSQKTKYRSNIDDVYEYEASDDDEEIDSDAAFEESDEDRFAGFFSDKKAKKKANNSKKKPSVRFADVDLNEDDDVVGREDEQREDDNDEEDEEMGEGDQEFISLVDILDGKGEADTGDDENLASKPLSNAKSPVRDEEDEDERMDDGAEEEVEEEEEDGNEEEVSADEAEIHDFAPSDEEEAPEALDDLENFITSLGTTDKKRKAQADSGTALSEGPKRKRRQIIQERTEAGAENEFRAIASGPKLQLEDLLAPLASQSSALQSLKKSTKALTSTSAKSGKTLSAPLPQRAQERLDREAAYAQTKQEVDKWKDTMKRIREAEHLSFPLQEPNSMGRTSNLELNAKFKPSNELESSIDALLKAANMRDESDLMRTEENILKANKLTLEEVAERRAELRRMRDLMFRAELKARRINKIKSKTYRKLRRKEKDRLGQLTKDAGEEEGEEERIERERERAMERATLRHKQTGKWARQMQSRGDTLGEDERREMEEMLSRGEKLRRRIQGVGSDESEGDQEESDEDEDVYDEEGEQRSLQKIKQSAFDELQRVNKQDEGLENDMNNEKRSVFSMKFMKEAMVREKAAANKIADDFLKELGGNDLDANAEDGTEDAVTAGVVSERVGGRVSFRPGGPGISLRPMTSLASDTSSATLKSTDLPTSPVVHSAVPRIHASPAPFSPTVPAKSIQSASPMEDASNPASSLNPWLTRPYAQEAVATSKASRKNEVVISKDSKAAEKSKNKLRKLAMKQAEEKQKQKDDATLEIEVGNRGALTLRATSSAAAVGAEKAASASNSTPSTTENGNNGLSKNRKYKRLDSHATSATQQREDAAEDSDTNTEIEAQEDALEAKRKGLKAFQQRDLVALAFAGDSVVQQFEETKLREITADAPKQVDTTIPGWGSWGGTGIRKAPSKPSRIKTIPGVDPANRADYNKKHVIISERRDKKAAKYMVKDLPFPYTSKAQFERSMERPLGTEWNTRVGFQRATLPRVAIKPGSVITPLRKFSS